MAPERMTASATEYAQGVATHPSEAATIEVAAAIGETIVYTACAMGVDASVLTACTGFDRNRAADPDAKISLELETNLWNEAARLTGDEAFGLHAAARTRPGALGVLDYAIRTAPTLRTSLERLVRYNRLVHDTAHIALVRTGGAVRIEHGLRGSRATQSRHAAEFTIASVFLVGGQLVKADLRPLAVEFQHGRPSPRAVDAHVSLFGREPLFAQNLNALVLDAEVLDRPNVQADAALSCVIEHHAEALLAQRPAPGEAMADRVRRVLAGALGKGEASLTAVAAKLRTSERSLQRKLADEGVAFDAILDEFRRDLALRYLADPKIAVTEVAYLLGYSEPSPFHRAFKRWTGVTPTEARKRAA